MSETKTRYRATCSCGYKGRAFINGNDAVSAMEAHAWTAYEKHLPDRSFKGHFVDIEEVTR